VGIFALVVLAGCGFLDSSGSCDQPPVTVDFIAAPPTDHEPWGGSGGASGDPLTLYAGVDWLRQWRWSEEYAEGAHGFFTEPSGNAASLAFTDGEKYLHEVSVFNQQSPNTTELLEVYRGVAQDLVASYALERQTHITLISSSMAESTNRIPMLDTSTPSSEFRIRFGDGGWDDSPARLFFLMGLKYGACPPEDG